MAIVAYFETDFTQQQYDQVLSGLAAKGLQAPTGRQYHVTWNTPQGWRVLDVWDSEETLGKFAEDLMPIISGTGATPPQPQIFPVYNIIKGG